LKFPGLTLVVSPLIALMKDQVDALRANGISAAFLNSSLTPQEMMEVRQSAEAGELKLLYVAPERLATAEFQTMMRSLEISLFAIDEAHCISEWGHDFRPDYRNLKSLRRDFPTTPIIALTATATPIVQRDIEMQLKLSGKTFHASFDRPNLTYQVEDKKDFFPKILTLLNKYEGQPAIIYCFSRKDTETIASNLREHKINAQAYHAGLSPEKRSETQTKFSRDEVSVIVATIAFGMGIDKPDIRLVIHCTVPKSLEGYYQETGRAGRDGLASDCVLFYSYADKFKQEFFIKKIKDKEERAQSHKKLLQAVDFCQLESCRRAYLLDYFGEELIMEGESCEGCDRCLDLSAIFEGISPVEFTESPRKKRTSKRTSKKSARRTRSIRRKPVELEYDKALFSELSALRKRIADERGVPSFVIFGNKSLQEMAHYLPQTKHDFLSINGVGAQKLESLGDEFINLIRSYSEAVH
ncbi:hypothetical protein CO046_03930, partial [Candidatus Peregrinibacteria bacterium CG_4_9_14_0_2_um_filter_53_11]